MSSCQKNFSLLSYWIITILLPPSDAGLSFVGVSERNITVLKGTSQSLSWTYQGTDEGTFTGISWLTYIPRSHRIPSNLKILWVIDTSGNRDTHIPEQPSYQGRLSATKNGQTVSLKITNVQLNDANVYFCQLLFFGSSSVTSSAINLNVAEKPVVSVPQSSQSCNQGQSCTLQCSASGTPQIIFSWTRTGQTIELSNQASYVISLVRRSDAGSYTCKATNIVGSDQKNINLIVNYLDIDSSSSSPSEVESWNGHVTELKCVAAGQSDSFTFTWSGPVTQTVTNQGGVSRLTFIPSQDSHYGEYKCQVQNVVGTIYHWIKLIQIKVPGAPNIISLNPSVYSINVTWNAPVDNGGREVTQYTVERNKTIGDKWISYDTTDLSLIISELKIATNYRIRVSAWNVAGQGPKSEVQNVTTLNEGPPDPPFILNSETQLTNNKLVLRWTQPNNGGHPIIKYSIQYNKKNTNNQRTKDVLGNQTLQTEVELFWDSINVVTVYAHNSLGRSTSGENSIMELTVGPDPEKISCKFQCLQKNELKILVCEESQGVNLFECMNSEDTKIHQLTTNYGWIVQQDSEWKCRGKGLVNWSDWSNVMKNQCENVDNQTYWNALIGVSSTLGLLVLLFIAALIYLRYKSPDCLKQPTQKPQSVTSQTATSNQTSGQNNDTFYMELQPRDAVSGQPQAEYEPVHSSPDSSTSSPVQSPTPATYEPSGSTRSQVNEPQRTVPNTTYEPLQTVTRQAAIYAQLNQGVYDNSPINARV